MIPACLVSARPPYQWEPVPRFGSTVIRSSIMPVESITQALPSQPETTSSSEMSTISLVPHLLVVFQLFNQCWPLRKLFSRGASSRTEMYWSDTHNQMQVAGAK